MLAHKKIVIKNMAIILFILSLIEVQENLQYKISKRFSHYN
ncbi:hypothetical protein FLAVO9AF_970015 [Flavobacterium sp. 9AF]|nr:hypothetical protein FLAVO9AF_970015 [Flavobacterium sp. 9AF]